MNHLHRHPPVFPRRTLRAVRQLPSILLNVLPSRCSNFRDTEISRDNYRVNDTSRFLFLFLFLIHNKPLHLHFETCKRAVLFRILLRIFKLYTYFYRHIIFILIPRKKEKGIPRHRNDRERNEERKKSSRAKRIILKAISTPICKTAARRLNA